MRAPQGRSEEPAQMTFSARVFGNSNPNAHVGILVHLRSHGTWGESQVAMLRTV